MDRIQPRGLYRSSSRQDASLGGHRFQVIHMCVRVHGMMAEKGHARGGRLTHRSR